MMFELLDEVKVLRDPIHGYIHIHNKVVWDCMGTKEFQRLRRIKQLGMSYLVYHTAEHSRFAHSLGVYEIVRRMTEEVGDVKEQLTDHEKVVVMLAALLHDIGHMPFSHAFEKISKVSHEDFTVQILTGDTEVHEVLEKAHPGLSMEVAQVINHTHPNNVMIQMVSGQLDADRMDYLLRDAYFTGTKYGEFDLERVLRTLRVSGNRLVVKESGIHTIEDYIMARYHMYWQVYYHPVVRSAEHVLVSLFKRYRELNMSSYPSPTHVFDGYLSGQPGVKEHLMLDEAACQYGIAQMCSSTDPIMADLAIRLRDRKLFEYEDVKEGVQDKVRNDLVNRGYDPSFYMFTDEVSQSPYLPYGGNDKSIWVLMNDGSVKELADASVIVSSLVNGKKKDDYKVFYPM